MATIAAATRVREAEYRILLGALARPERVKREREGEQSEKGRRWGNAQQGNREERIYIAARCVVVETEEQVARVPPVPCRGRSAELRPHVDSRT